MVGACCQTGKQGASQKHAHLPQLKQVHCMPGRRVCNSLLPYADDLWPGWDIVGLFTSMPASCCAGNCWLLPVMQSAACQTV